LWHFYYALVGLKLHCIHLNVNFKQSSGVFKLRPNVILKQVSDPIELHYVPWFALQPEFVKLYEEVAVKVMEVIKGWPPFIEIEQVWF